MKLLSSKYFILFLIIGIVFYSASFQTAEAGFKCCKMPSFSGAVNNIVGSITAAAIVAIIVAPIAIINPILAISLIVTGSIGGGIIGQSSLENGLTLVFNNTINTVIAVGEIAVGTVFKNIGIDNSILQSGKCRLSNRSDDPAQYFFDQCNATAGVVYTSGVSVSATDIGCVSLIQTNFYNNQANLNYQQIGTADINGQQMGICDAQANFDETNRKIAIYRFTLPSNSGNQAFNDWYNSIKTKVGNGWLNVSNNQYYSAGGVEATRLTEINYFDACSGNNCNFTDTTAPKDSYIAYAAKIIGSYSGSYNVDALDPVTGVMTTYRVCGAISDNKFLSKSNSGLPDFPSNSASNGIIGPFKTGGCPTLSFNVSPIVEVPNPINIGWNSTNTISSCVANGDWSGSKALFGSEFVSKPRGNYVLGLTCYNNSGMAVSKVATSSVIQVPQCSFSAASSTIVLPQSTAISWNCDYANSCSINQGIGSVNSISGSVTVRPNQNTNYVISCNGLDGSKAFTASVNLGSSSKVQYKEVIPK